MNPLQRNSDEEDGKRSDHKPERYAQKLIVLILKDKGLHIDNINNMEYSSQQINEQIESLPNPRSVFLVGLEHFVEDVNSNGQYN